MTNAQFTVKLPAKCWGNLDTKLENTHTHTHIYGKIGHNWDPKVDRTITLQTLFFFLEANLEVQEGNLLKNNSNNVTK